MGFGLGGQDVMVKPSGGNIAGGASQTFTFTNPVRRACIEWTSASGEQDRNMLGRWNAATAADDDWDFLCVVSDGGGRVEAPPGIMVKTVTLFNTGATLATYNTHFSLTGWE